MASPGFTGAAGVIMGGSMERKKRTRGEAAISQSTKAHTAGRDAPSTAAHEKGSPLLRGSTGNQRYDFDMQNQI